MTRLQLAVGALCFAICGCSSNKDNVLGPTPAPTAQIITFVSGETKTPVSGASVTVSSTTPAFSRKYQTDAQGRIGLGTDVPQVFPLSMDITAPAYLDRATYLRSASDSEFTLWPTVSPTALDADFSSALAYSPSGCPTSSTGTALARRMNSSVRNVWVTFDSSLQDAQAEAAHVAATSRLNTAIGGAVTYGVSATPGDGVVFTAQIDPNAATCTAGPEPLRAATFTTVSSPSQEIIGGRLVYCTVQAARSVGLVLHELGHTYGLYHAPTQSDVMYCSSGRPSFFTPRESLVMNLVRQRRSGNRWPDNDRQAVGVLDASRAGSQTEIQVCGGF